MYHERLSIKIQSADRVIWMNPAGKLVGGNVQRAIDLVSWIATLPSCSRQKEFAESHSTKEFATSCHHFQSGPEILWRPYFLVVQAKYSAAEEAPRDLVLSAFYNGGASR